MKKIFYCVYMALFMMSTSCSNIADDDYDVIYQEELHIDELENNDDMFLLDNVAVSDDAVTQDFIVIEGDSNIFDGIDINQLYQQYILGEISVANPYVENDNINILSYKESDASSFADAVIGYALIDVNGDSEKDLIINVQNNIDQLLVVMTVAGDELLVIDIFESHSLRMGFSVYDNGVIRSGRSYDDLVDEYFTYDENGNRNDIISFFKACNSDAPQFYEYYYINGNPEEKITLSNDDDFYNAQSQYVGNPVEYTDITEYVESLAK